MNIINTSGAMPEAFDSGHFQIEKWKTYLDAAVPGLTEMCLEDLQETMNAGYSWQDDYLPVLNSVMQDPARREKQSNHSAASQIIWMRKSSEDFKEPWMRTSSCIWAYAMAPDG